MLRERILELELAGDRADQMKKRSTDLEVEMDALKSLVARQEVRRCRIRKKDRKLESRALNETLRGYSVGLHEMNLEVAQSCGVLAFFT